jgi:hypothetical protein
MTDLHGGTIEAHSTGLGQAVNSSYGCHCAPQTVEETTTQTVVDKPDTGWRILVVADNVDAADSLALFVRECGP